MSTAVIVNGALGKMGRLACETIDKHPDFHLVAGLTRKDDLAQTIKQTKAQIVIDLTRADCVFANTKTIIDCGAHPIIGTSGLQPEQIAQLTELASAHHLGGVIVPNFSISAVLMMRFAAQAAHYLSEVEIIEMHHQQKFDAPSGTAMKTAEMIASAQRHPKNELTSQESITGVRGGTHHDIPIHSLRLPGVLARQQIIFGSAGETLSIIHDSIDRGSFMPGLILCCQKVSLLDTLYYGLEHVM